MRLAVVPDGILERVALTLGVVPTPLVQLSWGMGSSRSILAGVRLGVFDTLEDGPSTAAAVAGATGCSVAGIETLLSSLNGFGNIRHRDGLYTNTKVTSRYLVRGAKQSMVDMVLFMGDLWNLFSDLEGAVRDGSIADLHHGDHPPEFWERYLRGLAPMAAMMAKEVARRVKFATPPRRLLDVAGGHGMFSVGLCRRHPELRAEVLDLPMGVPVGEQLVAETDVADRVIYRPGDLRTDPWGEDHDAVLLFNIIHNLTEDESRAAIAAAHAALRPGGQLVILDADHRRSRRDVDQTGGFSELLCYVTSGTRAYPVATMRDWMAAAGFGRIKTQKLFTGPYMALITGEKS